MSYAKTHALIQAIERMKDEAIEQGIWYTFLPTEYAEDVGEALDEIQNH